MPAKITVDATEPLDVGVAEPGTTWQEIDDYVRIAHNPVLAVPPDATQYRGVYWDPSTAMTGTTGDLGSDLHAALSEFRAILLQPQSDPGAG